MLATEAFAEVVAFLRLFDLSALLATNALCSSLAVQASTGIRWDEFPGFCFHMYDKWIQIFRQVDAPNDEDRSLYWQFVAALRFTSENDTAEFVVAAFPNSTVEHVAILRSESNLILDAIGQVADSVIVKGVLFLPGSLSPEDSLNLARKFRKVKALQLERAVSDDEVNQIANFSRGSGIQELWYRSYDDSTLRKLAII